MASARRPTFVPFLPPGSYEAHVQQVIRYLLRHHPYAKTTAEIRSMCALPLNQPQGILRSLRSQGVVNGYRLKGDRAHRWYLTGPASNALRGMGLYQ